MSSRAFPLPGEGDGSAGPYGGPLRRAHAVDGLGRTRRERLRELLLSTEEGVPLDAIEKILEATRSTIIADLEHLRLSFKHQDAKLLMVPPTCEDCGYTFRLEAPKAPSRCPMCKSRDLSEPIFKATAEA